MKRMLLWLWSVVALTTAAPAEDFSALVKAARDAVVRVEVSGGGKESLGTGFVVREDGVVATNFHVIDDAARGKVVFEDGRTFEIKGLLASRPDHDMALLKIESSEKLPCLPLCDKLPEQGSDVFTFGNPKGLRFVVTRGIVSAIADTAEIMASDQKLARELRGDYSPDATWIQTDAPISGGNSGGPLINADGEVVGINTWHRTDGQNLNFAGSALTLRKMLKLATDVVSPLPMARPAAGLLSATPPGLPATVTARDRIALPSGKSLDFSIFNDSATILTDVDRARMQAQGAFQLEYPSGKPFALLQHLDGKLHGLCCAQHENGSPMLLGRYEKGDRAGNFRLVSDEGKPLFSAQYVKGKREGYTCFYKDGEPYLIQEVSKGRPMWSHLLENWSVTESLDHKATTYEEASEAMKTRLDKLEEFEKQMKTNEISVKKIVFKLDEDVRKQRAAARGAYTQQMMLQRINERAAERSSLINGLRQASGF